MVSMEVRKIVMAGYDDGMKETFISHRVWVSVSGIYRMLEKVEKPDRLHFLMETAADSRKWRREADKHGSVDCGNPRKRA